MATTPPDNTEQFVRLVNAAQRGLYAYILTMVPARTEANDILQETNLVLWRKREEFQMGTNFEAWAARIAHNKVLSHRGRQARDRLRFDDALVEQLADEGLDDLASEDPELDALSNCLKKLPEKDRDLLDRRYGTGLQARQISGQIGRSARAVAQALYRIRTTLLRCIEQTLAVEGDR